MTTRSYPAVGKGGFSDAYWSSAFKGNDGVVNDFTGNGLQVDLISASNIARVQPGMASVNGYFLEVTEAHDLPVPTGAGTYHVAAMYQPSLNVPLPNTDPPQADPLGPCRLVIGTTLDTTGGREYLLLRSITRAAGQALSAATVVTYRPHLGPSISIGAMPAQAKTRPETALVGFQYPVGTVAYEESTGETWRKVQATDGSVYWQASTQGPFSFAFSSGLGSRDAAPSTPQYYKFAGSMVGMQGALARANGNELSSGNDINLGVLPAGFRPAFTVRFACKVGAGNKTPAEVRVGSDGLVTMTGNGTIDWIDLSTIQFRAAK